MAERSCKRSTRKPDLDNASGGILHITPSILHSRGCFSFMCKRAIVFVNGDLPNLDAARNLMCDDDFIIAADGGTRHALAMSLVPSVVIGDLDSLGSVNLPASVEIIQHAEDKDETDLELALHYARERDFEQIRLIGALGGRLDQTLGNLSLLSDSVWDGVDVRMDDGVEEILFARNQAQINGRIGDIVSLIPWGGDVNIAKTVGLRWLLKNEILFTHQTRGISNEMTLSNANIDVEKGLLLIVHTRKEEK